MITKAAKKSKAKAATVPPSTERLLELATWHGGLLMDGSLWITPVLCGLGYSMSRTKYRQWLDQVISSTFLEALWTRLDLKIGETHSGTMQWPALNISVPMPGAEVIDAALDDPALAPHAKTLARQQLEQATAQRQWGLFPTQFIKIYLFDSRTAEVLLAADGQDLLLSRPLRDLLSLWLTWRQAIDLAYKEGTWLLWTGFDLAPIYSKMQLLEFRSQKTFHGKKTWSSFVKARTDKERSLSEFVWSEKTRITEDTLERLVQDARYASNVEEFDPKIQKTWSIFPHLRAEVLRDLISQMTQALAGYHITLDGERFLGFTEFPGGQSPAAMESLWRHRDMRPCLLFFFEILIQHALDHDFYKSHKLNQKETLEAMVRRQDPEALLSVFWSQESCRSPDAPLTLIRRHIIHQTSGSAPEASAEERWLLEPSLMRPSCAAIPPKSRAKKFKTLDQRYMTLKAWQNSRPEDTTLVTGPDASSTGVRLPQLRSWQASDFISIFSMFPQLLANTVVLAKGGIEVPHDEPIGQPSDGANATLEDMVTAVPPVQAWDLFYLSSLSSSGPSLEPAAFAVYRSHRQTLQTLDGGLAPVDIRLGLRYESSTGVEISALVKRALDLMTTTQRTVIRQDGSTTATLSQETQDALTQLRDQLTFTAVPLFIVNGAEVSEAEWFGAKKTGGGSYLLANGMIVSKDHYQTHTERFVTRQRVLAKYRRVGLFEMWRAQRDLDREESTSLSPEEYLRQRSLQVAPLIAELDQATLTQIAAQTVVPSLGPLASRLRPYQIHGIAWLYQRVQLGLGVCLADEMGLGKTAQAIGLLSLLSDGEKPSLVVVPKSLLSNWVRELTAFAPTLQVRVFPDQGSNIADMRLSTDVIVTTYPRLRMHTEISEMEWNVVILDEAQAIKNRDSQTAVAAGNLTCRRRVALTGTPIENDARELWSLVDWLNDGYLGTQTDFSAFVQSARSTEHKPILMAPLRACLAPLILRRTKDDPKIALSLPPKIYEPQTASLSEEQEFLYRAVLEVILAEDMVDLPLFARQAAYLKAILHLKQICNHPGVFYGQEEADEVVEGIDREDRKLASKIRQVVRQRLKTTSKSKRGLRDILDRSGKLGVFYELVQDLKETSHGILVFTQYRASAAMMQEVLHLSGVEAWQEVPFLHGGLTAKDRQQMIDDFAASCEATDLRRRQDPSLPCPILILSLKAGGTGLNLTSADRVIHYDRWWNPAVEDQATDRAHRMGQNKTVFVHTITTERTLEAAFEQLFDRKRGLMADFLGAAEVGGISSQLRDEGGFLDLVDPDRYFVPRVARG